MDEGKYKHITEATFLAFTTWCPHGFPKNIILPKSIQPEYWTGWTIWHNFHQILLKTLKLQPRDLSVKAPNPLITDLILRYLWNQILTLTWGYIWPNETACLSADVHTHLRCFILGVLFHTFLQNMSTLIKAIKSPSKLKQRMTSHAIKCHLSQSVLIVWRDTVPSLSHRKRQVGAMQLNCQLWRIYFQSINSDSIV